jgi:hypothetical protein
MSYVTERQAVMVATAWAVSPDGQGGDLVGLPIPIKCRWEDRNEEFADPRTGEQQISNAVVYVDRTLKVGDWLYNGASDEPLPQSLDRAYKIKRFDNTPNLRNLKVIRKAYL